MLNPPEWAKNEPYAANVYFKSGPRTGGQIFYSRSKSFGREVKNPEQLALDRLVRMIAGWGSSKIETAEIYDMRDGQRLLHKFTGGSWVQ